MKKNICIYIYTYESLCCIPESLKINYTSFFFISCTALHVESSFPTRDQTSTPPAFKVQNLNHWSTREAHILQLQKENVPGGQEFWQRGHHPTHFTLACRFVIYKIPAWLSEPERWVSALFDTDSHRGLPWWFSGKESPCNAGDPGLIPESGRSPGEGNGCPLKYSCL